MPLGFVVIFTARCKKVVDVLTLIPADTSWDFTREIEEEKLEF